MQLARNFAVLLLALAGVSSAAVDRRDGLMRDRHLHAARDYSLRGIIEDVEGLVNLVGGGPDKSSTTTTTTSTTTTPDPTSTTETTTTTESSSSTTEPDQSSSSTTTSTTVKPFPTQPPDCVPMILLGETIGCKPTTSTTVAPTPTCEPIVVRGVTLSACDEQSSTTTTTTTTTPPPESTPDPTSTSDPTTTSDPPNSTTDVPEPTITADPTTTTTTEAPETTKPGDECTPQVVLGITISACDPESTAEPTTTTTTEQPTITQPPQDPDPTTTSPPGTTTTVPPDPCDPGLLDPLLGGVLPGFCTQNPTTDPPQTETTPFPPDTTTRPGGEDSSTTPVDPPTTTNPDQESSTSDQPTLDPPTDVFPTDSETDGPNTFSSSPTATRSWSNSNSIPTYLTNTELGLDTPTASSSGVFETDPDAVPTPTNPESQQDQPTDVPMLPNNMPNYILSSNAPTIAPSGMTLVTIMLRPELNWWHVVNHPEVAVQLITYGGIMVADALNIPQDQVIVLALQAWIPSPYDGNPRNLLTLIKVYVPSNMVDQLQLILLSPNSAMYTQQREPVAKTLVMYIDPSFPLTSGGSGGAGGGGGGPNGSEAGGNLDDLLDNGDDGDAARTKAIIGVCVAVGALLLIGLAWWGYKNYKLKQEQAHRRLSQNSDTQFASAANVPTYGAVGGMQERARQRDSFFFAEDSLRGYEADRRFDEGETYDHRSMAGTAGGALSSRTFSGQGGGAPGGVGQYGGQPIQPGAISAPILRENTLNW